MKRKLLGLTTWVLFVCSVALSPVAFANPQGSVYRLKQAGIQVTVPSGWEVETEANGATFSKKEKQNSLAIASLTTIEGDGGMSLDDIFKVAWQGAVESMKGDLKNFQKVGNAEKGDQNGIPVMTQAFSGVQNGLQMVGVLCVMKANRPTMLMIYGTANTSAAFDKEFDKLMDSIRKIQ